MLEHNVAHWQLLDPEERAHLQRLVQVFANEKDWEGCGGLTITDEIRVTISGLACLLLLGLDHDYYRNVSTILVYPSTVVTPERASALAGGLVVSTSGMPIAGEASMRGPVLLVWDAVRHGAVHPERGHNVVYHEFAHKLDMLDGTIDGTPPLTASAHYQRWVEVCTREYEELKQRSADGEETFLDAYGTTNVGEFFAVATELFFARPVGMQERHPELYSVLQGYYRQDPAERARRSATGSRAGS